MLLKSAFNRELIFTVRQNATRTGDVVVIWYDVHHKTDKTEGSRYDYKGTNLHSYKDTNLHNYKDTNLHS